MSRKIAQKRNPKGGPGQHARDLKREHRSEHYYLMRAPDDVAKKREARILERHNRLAVKK